MGICESGQIGDEEEIKKQLNIGGCFIVLKLRVFEQGLVLGCDIGHALDCLTAPVIQV